MHVLFNWNSRPGDRGAIQNSITTLQKYSYKLNHHKKFLYKRMANVIDTIFKADQDNFATLEVSSGNNVDSYIGYEKVKTH